MKNELENCFSKTWYTPGSAFPDNANEYLNRNFPVTTSLHIRRCVSGFRVESAKSRLLVSFVFIILSAPRPWQTMYARASSKERKENRRRRFDWSVHSLASLYNTAFGAKELLNRMSATVRSNIWELFWNTRRTNIYIHIRHITYAHICISRPAEGSSSRTNSP